MSTMPARLIDGLVRAATWRNTALAFGGMVLSNLALGGYVLPSIQARQPAAMDDGFLVMVDLVPLCSADQAYRIYDLYTPDILGLVRLLYALDFAMPLMFALFAVCLLGAMVRVLEVKGGLRATLLLPFVAVSFDYVENALSLLLIGQYQDGRVFPTLARVTGIVTTAKFLALAGVGLALVILLLRTVMTLLARRASRPQGPRSGPP